MTAARPQDRVVVRFGAPSAAGAAALVALEDYARELTRARAAEALLAEDGSGHLIGVALDAPLVAPQGTVLDDIEAFARDLAERSGGGP